MTDKPDNALEAELAALGSSTRGPSDALLARVLADADAVAVAPVAIAPVAAPRPKRRFGAFFDGFGLSGGLALAASAVLGLFVGVYTPMSAIDAYLWDSDWTEMVTAPDPDFFLLEDVE